MMLMLPSSVEQAARAVSPASTRICNKTCMHLGMNCRMAHLVITIGWNSWSDSSSGSWPDFAASLRGRSTWPWDSSTPKKRRSRLALPAPFFVRLPIGHLEAAGPGFGPAHARGLERIGILAVEQQHDTRIACGILRHRRALDEETHRSAIGVVGVDGDQDRLTFGLRIAPGAVRQKAVVGEGPQMAVKRLHPLFRGRLHHHAPATLKRFLE